MKKLLAALALPFIALTTQAQITLEHSYSLEKEPMQLVLLSQGGYKYVVIDTGSNVVQLYNTDNTLWKNIPVPPLAGYRFNGNVWAVSDNLFNNDNLVEMVVSYASTSGGFVYHGLVVNETGSTVQDLQNASTSQVLDEGGVFKLSAYAIVIDPNTGASYIRNDVYSLPGTLPCGSCGALGTKQVQQQRIGLMDAVPNPANSATLIGYILAPGETGTLAVINSSGQRIKAYQVNSTSNSITLPTGELTPGNYFYNLTTATGISETKQLVIVK